MKLFALTFILSVTAILTTVKAALNPPSEETLDALFSVEIAPNLEDIRRYFSDPCFSDAFLWSAYHEAKRTRSFINVCLVRLASNSLATGRGSLFTRFFAILKSQEFVIPLALREFTGETMILQSALSLPHLTAAALETEEFQGVLQAAIENVGESVLLGMLYPNSLNLHLISFLERRFPLGEFKNLHFAELNMLLVRYGMTLQDILPGFRHYASKGLLDLIFGEDLAGFPQLSRLLNEARDLVLTVEVIRIDDSVAEHEEGDSSDVAVADFVEAQFVDVIGEAVADDVPSTVANPVTDDDERPRILLIVFNNNNTQN